MRTDTAFLQEIPLLKQSLSFLPKKVEIRKKALKELQKT